MVAGKDSFSFLERFICDFVDDFCAFLLLASTMVQSSQFPYFLILFFLIVGPTQIKACTSNDDCLNGGVCEYSWIATADEGFSTPVCNCLSGYWGYDCRDTCELKCENRGQCGFGKSSDHGGSDVDSGEVVCKCPQNFEGPLCSIRDIGEDVQEIDDEGADSSEDTKTTAPITSAADTSSSSPSAGAKFGIVLLVVWIIGLVGVVSTRLLRKRQRRSNNPSIDHPPPPPGSTSSVTESAEERDFA